MKGFEFYNSQLPTGKKQIMNLHSSEEATYFRARSIALASALQIELADVNRRELTCCQKSVADATLSPSV